MVIFKMKKIIEIIAILAIVVAVAWNVNLGSKTNGMSDVKLANVEALADEYSYGSDNRCDTK